MGKIVAFSNQKGGVGKTTTAINLAAYVAKADRKVLLLDFDPQGNATSGFGVDKNNLPINCYDFLMGKATAEQVIRETMIENLYLMPCNTDLAAAEVSLVGEIARESKLKYALEEVKKQYDYVFIDCPPSLGLITLNALVAADRVVIPIQSEFFALEGLAQLMNTLKIVKQRLNPELKINGVVLTMYESRTIMSRQVTSEIIRFFGSKVYKVPVPRNVKLVESPSFGVPIVKHAPRCGGAVAYEKLAELFLQREEEDNG